MDSSLLPPALVYCRCAYAQVLLPGVKQGVLDRLCASERSFEGVSDLCEMAAHRDPRLIALVEEAAQSGRSIRIAACHERAVRGLFHQAGATLPPTAQVVNMRELSAEAAAEAMLAAEEATAG
jgi:hypothetical protein